VNKENGLSIEEAVHDKDRVDYYRGYLNAMLAAVEEDGVDVRSYFAWSKFTSSPFSRPVSTSSLLFRS
jgi:beta-glucosidase